MFEKLLIFLDFKLERELILDHDSIHASHFLLVLIHRSDPTVHSDLALHVFYLVMKPFSSNRLYMVFNPQFFILLMHLHVLGLNGL